MNANFFQLLFLIELLRLYMLVAMSVRFTYVRCSNQCSIFQLIRGFYLL